MENLISNHCWRHPVVFRGEDDDAVPNSNTDNFMSGSAEAGGESNRLWCRFVHRNRDKEIK